MGVMLGKSLNHHFFDEYLPEHRKNMESYRQGRDQSYEMRFRKKDGTTLWTIVAATDLNNDTGNSAGFFGMFTDITERKATEEKLIESETRHGNS